MEAYYTAVSCIGRVGLMVLEYVVRTSDLLEPGNKRFFRLSIWTVMVVILAEMVTVFFENGPLRYRWLHVLGNVCGFGLSPLVPLLIGCAINGEHRRSLLYFSLPVAVSGIFSVFSIWFPAIFWVDEANGYARAGAFWVYVVAYGVGLIFLLLQTTSITRRYQNENRLLPTVLFCFVGLGTTVQVVAPQLHVSWLCVSVALILFYVYCCDLLHQIDGLTGLLNRRTYEYSLHKIKRRSNYAVFIFDLDDFKSINDVYGHPFGDQCLIAVSACIRRVFFRQGMCFRIGGDEFCVITKRTSKSNVDKACRRFLHEIDTLRQSDPRLPLVSVGWAYASSKSESISSLVTKADRNMYQLKRKRKKAARETE